MVRLGSTGPVVKGVTLKLLDKDPRTGVGEIAVKGDNVTRGYFKNPEATAAAFTEDGWFKTRDLGRLDRDGWLYIKGRSSTTIIGPSGENIYPEEVESVINSHEMVAESVVTSRKGRLLRLRETQGLPRIHRRVQAHHSGETREPQERAPRIRQPESQQILPHQ